MSGGYDGDTLDETREDERHAQAPRFWLLVVAGPDTGATFTSSGERTVIGTHDAADLVLHDSTVSRFHCEIAPAGGRALLRDLGSLNGTLVNGVGVLEAVLRSGATLSMGRTQVRFDVGAEAAALPLSRHGRFGRLVGESAVMRRVFAVLERAAAGESTVLLEGEAGVGKLTAAEAIHAASARARGPFVVVDCAALPADVLELELFGREDEGLAGAFEEARGGTLLLREIGELPLELQPPLLAVLERREVRRVGASRSAPVDARVIAAASHDVRADVNAKRFRSDLYHRLAGLTVRLPPLRERREDLLLLAEELRGAGPLSEELARELAERSWPGNVAELRRALELRAAAEARPEQAPDEAIRPADLARPLEPARVAFLRRMERRYAEELVARHGQDREAAARAAGVDRVGLDRLAGRDAVE